MSSLRIRRTVPADFDRWLPLWEGYNEFYKRTGPAAVPLEVTRATWSRLHDPAEPMFAFVAEDGERLVGFTHALYHRNTARLAPVCYLQDLFTADDQRGRGIGRALIEAVSDEARRQGSPHVYWQTHETNATAMRLYDQVAARSGFVIYSKKL